MTDENIDSFSEQRRVEIELRCRDVESAIAWREAAITMGCEEEARRQREEELRRRDVESAIAWREGSLIDLEDQRAHRKSKIEALNAQTAALQRIAAVFDGLLDAAHRE